MKGFKEAYYRKLKSDFDDRKENSAIFIYNLKEYETNPRIMIAKSCGEFKEQIENADGDEARKYAVRTFANSLVEILKNDRGIVSRLDDSDLADKVMDDISEDRPVDIAVLTKLADEMEALEFAGERKNYVRMRMLQLRYDYGDMDITEFVAGYLSLKLGMPKINMEKDKGYQYITDGRMDIRVHNRNAIRKSFAELKQKLIQKKMKTREKLKALIDIAEHDPDTFDRTVRECFRDSSVKALAEEYFDDDLPCVRCFRPGMVQVMAYEMLYAILWFDISAQFYDMGFRQVKDSEETWQMDSGVEQPDLTPRKMDKSLDLMDMLFFKDNLNNPFSRISSSGSSGEGSDEELKNASTKLLEALNAQKRDDVCIPLRIDRITGSGVYILGRRYYQGENFEIMRRKGQYSRFGIVQPSWGISQDNIFEVRDIYEWERDDYQDVVDIWQNEVIDDVIEDMVSYNGQAPAGCPESFLKWFSDEEDSYYPGKSGNTAGRSYLPDIGAPISARERADASKANISDSGCDQIGNTISMWRFRW